MGTVAWSVGSDSPEPPPVSPSKYETSARSTSLRPSIAIAKYGPLGGGQGGGGPAARRGPPPRPPARRRREDPGPARLGDEDRARVGAGAEEGDVAERHVAGEARADVPGAR